jgi:hypothetical protein
MTHWGTFVQQLLLRKCNEYYTTCVCVCVCVFVCVCVCVCVFVTLGNLHAMRKLHIVIFGLSRSTIYFTFSHKRHDFLKKKKVTVFKMCAFVFSTTFVWHISHSKKKWARCIQKYTLADVKYPLFFSDFNETWNFRDWFKKKPLKYQLLWKFF